MKRTERKQTIPSTSKEWIEEIAKAYLDACDAIPFGYVTGKTLTPKDLFHLGPIVCLKFRGIEGKKKLKIASTAAIASYVATKEITGDLFDIPQIAFTFSYLASHYGLDLIDEDTSTRILDYIRENLNRLLKLTET